MLFQAIARFEWQSDDRSWKHCDTDPLIYVQPILMIVTVGFVPACRNGHLTSDVIKQCCDVSNDKINDLVQVTILKHYRHRVYSKAISHSGSKDRIWVLVLQILSNPFILRVLSYHQECSGMHFSYLHPSPRISGCFQRFTKCIYNITKIYPGAIKWIKFVTPCTEWKIDSEWCVRRDAGENPSRCTAADFSAICIPMFAYTAAVVYKVYLWIFYVGNVPSAWFIWLNLELPDALRAESSLFRRWHLSQICIFPTSVGKCTESASFENQQIDPSEAQ